MGRRVETNDMDASAIGLSQWWIKRHMQRDGRSYAEAVQIEREKAQRSIERRKRLVASGAGHPDYDTTKGGS